MGMNKKRAEREAEEQPSKDTPDDNGEFYDKKKKKKKRKKEQNDVESNETPTVSIAVPGSIIDNAQSLELATRLAGQIARAATIFQVDEVVVIDNKSTSMDESELPMEENSSDGNESGAAFLIKILRYLETPQYLRKSLFPKHNSLRFVGLLPPLDAPHHLRKHEWAPYREALQVFYPLLQQLKALGNIFKGAGKLVKIGRNKQCVTLKNQASDSAGTLVDVGLNKNVLIDQVIEPGRRVTVAMGSNRNLDTGLTYQVVPSSRPKDEVGMYWGYKVRYASNISAVLSGSPYKGGYDHLIGTSEHGVVIKSSELSLPSFRHLLIAFGGLAGLEECIEEDNNLKGKDVRQLFDLYLNTCPHQGSRTIRTEEAIFISLQYFQEPISRARDVHKKI